MLLRLRDSTIRAQPGIAFGATITATVKEAQLPDVTIAAAPLLQVVIVTRGCTPDRVPACVRIAARAEHRADKAMDADIPKDDGSM